VESRGFRKAQWSHGVSGKHSGVTGFQENTVESRGFRKTQWSHGVSVKHSGFTGFQESIVESWGFKSGGLVWFQVSMGESQ